MNKKSINDWPSATVPPIGDYFSTEHVKNIFKKAKLLKKINALKDERLSEIANKLNVAAAEHFTIKNLENKPTLKEIKKEITQLERASYKFYLMLLDLSFPAKYDLGLPKPVEFFENLQRGVLKLKVYSELALKNKLTGTKGGRPKVNRVNFINSIIDIYEEVTGQYAGRITNRDGKPTGLFFHFVDLCLHHIDKSLKIRDESISTEIKKALKLRPKYKSML